MRDLTQEDFVGKQTPYGVILDAGHPQGMRGKPFETFSFLIKHPDETCMDGTRKEGAVYRHAGYPVIFWMNEINYPNGREWFDWFWSTFKGVTFEMDIDGDEDDIEDDTPAKPTRLRLPGF